MQKESENIILTGMMGSGKSSVGAELAKLLNYKFIDLDEIIEKNYGKIGDIFSKNGEEYFREIETKELKNLEGIENSVISTGGGAILKDENIEIINSLGKAFYLSAQPETIYERIKEQTHRPLLKTQNPKETLKEILNSRLKKYEKSGQKIVTEGKNAAQIAQEI